ncbi:MAG: RidA family protein [Rickettsiales bacterium]|nr:RidA family protein [Rickettsiales bacterium]
MKTKIQNIYSGTKWEKEVAYCRAKKVGNMVFVSGTTAVDENGNIVGENVYTQSKFIFKKIENALKACGASLSDVVRTRTFITNINSFDEFARAHKENFSGIDPVATCVEVSRLVNNKLLIEIEVDANC